MDNPEKIIYLKERFFREFARPPRLFRAPGRVNLIGEHTDYNDGFVFPFAIDRFSIVAGASREDGCINVLALDIDDRFSFQMSDSEVRERGNWRDYVEGTARALHTKSKLQFGADMIFTSDVPIGAGLSSSAALEVSIGLTLVSLNGIEIDRKELAFAAQRAEHEFVGIRSGIMDQFASVFCRSGHALLLDCRSLEYENVVLRPEDMSLVVCDSMVKHELATTEYNTRRRECEAAVEILKGVLPSIKSLRDVSAEDLENNDELLPDVIKQRCRHVVYENARTIRAARALKENDLEEFGRLMFSSHESLRDDYEVSCPELDKLVDIAFSVGAAGARMTGGGFGGCTINLVQNDLIEDFSETIASEYSAAFGQTPQIYRFRAADGASEID